MYKQSEIKTQLIKTESITTKDDFVAIAVTIDEKGIANHSGILISHKGQFFFFHYDKTQVLLNEVDISNAKRIFHKELKIIDNKLIPSFINHCRIIKYTAKPKYGYFYGGSFYERGSYHSNNILPQLMTCVGFCINVITGFLEEKKYIEFTDWKPINENGELYFTEFIKKFIQDFPDADIEELRKDFRRIKPSEIISSGYFSELPIRKTSTDEVKPILEGIFEKV